MCDNPFYDTISNCTTAIRVNALLNPATPYTWLITDKFNKEYSGDVVSNAEGFIDIPVADLPDGLLNPFAGGFELRILDEDCGYVSFKMAAKHDRILFTVVGGSRVKNNLGCSFDCNASGGASNSAVFIFNDLLTLSIPWTSFLENLYGPVPTVQVFIETIPDHYVLTTVEVTQVGGPYDLTSIDIDFGGMATGYVLVS